MLWIKHFFTLVLHISFALDKDGLAIDLWSWSCIDDLGISFCVFSFGHGSLGFG